MNLTEMVAEFGDRVEGPMDYTDCYWQIGNWDLKWTEEGGEAHDPFEYSSEYRRMHRTTQYMICTIDNGCGETYQAVFDLSKEVSNV